ncbi:HlyD family efflux transporter periplasmic adaptor subunit [Shewanella sp. KX20019]|uniref:efflux RND transporter periplasmic adaptor subunit n=1 Tax=Shewanella sp. KX20019 TaxID=2803864 RepID=UPI0019281152|nr:HlyD family efflux transporter periplasmic adaptor subunit [Shewanella sp. KX20019]QQX80488.1 HlyD family efflux transporter periplasmic adaptor subunit [Shewanella sp. KX20019]
MDKQVTPSKTKQWNRWLVRAILPVLLISAFFYWQSNQSEGRVQKTKLTSLTVSTVKEGGFSDSLRLRGSISPKTSLFLDTIAGGRVEERLVEQGAYVKKGQPLLRLANTALQLDVMSREAQVTEQLNFLRNTQMTMETNRLNLKRDLLEVELQLAHLSRKITQSKPLVEQGVLAREHLLNLEQDLQYYQQRKELTLQRQQQEEGIRQLQVTQLEDSAKMLTSNLSFARKNVDNLLVKSPIDGYLSEFNVELGESKSAGSRLGRIDIPGKYKLVVNVDEYYLNQVQLGMLANLSFEGEEYALAITKIDSRVKQSSFTVELDLPATIAGVKRGQSLDVDLMFTADINQALLLKRGAFTVETGGNWVFVLSADGQSANRRQVKLGKKNQAYHQVISGLHPNEKVITSGYGAFEKADTLQIQL